MTVTLADLIARQAEHRSRMLTAWGLTPAGVSETGTPATGQEAEHDDDNNPED